MAVSIDEARHAARLARLALSDEALETLATDLSVVLDHFESVAQCASAKPPAAEPRRDGVFRPDTVGAMLTVDEALPDEP